MKKPNIIIYIPAYNAEPTLEELLTRLYNFSKHYKLTIKKIIVFDDGSTDNTNKILISMKKKFKSLSYIRNKNNSGPANAILVLMEIINKLTTNKKIDLRNTIIIRMDSDLEHQPEDIEKLTMPIITKKSNVSIGYISFDSRNGVINKYFNQYFGSIETKTFLGTDIPQFCPGFYCLRADIFKKIYPSVVQKAKEFENKYKQPMLIIDFVALVLAKKLDKNISVTRLMPIENKRIKKIPINKLFFYLKIHNILMDFLKTI